MILVHAIALLLLNWLAWWAPVLSVAASSVHAIEELARGPLWSYFHRAGGPRIPDAIGFVLFTLGLPLVLTIVAWFAYSNSYGWPSGALPANQWAVSLLLGLRIGDTLWSHWLLAAVIREPNPGLWTTPLYVIEAASLLFVADSWPWVLAGVAAFWMVNPVFGPLGIWRRKGGA